LDASAAAIKLHNSVHQGVQGLIGALTDPVARVVPRTDLPNQDMAGPNLLAAESLYAPPLAVGIPAVAA